MAARSGMADLITRVRQMTEAGTADYTLGAVTYWTDDHIQAVADRFRSYHTFVGLVARGQNIGGTTLFFRYDFPPELHVVEGTAGGTAVFRIDNSSGALVAATTYTLNADMLQLLFTADQGGTAYYWTGFAYDINAIARDMWLSKASHVWTAINFSADGHRFDRKAIHANCLRMAEQFGYEQGMVVSTMMRTDVAGPGDGDLF